MEAAGKIIAGSEIGRLIAISGQWAVRKPDHYYEMDWRRKPGGGPILINLIHDIDMMRLWCGEIESAYAETGNTERGFAVEDSGALVLRFQSGVRATITFSDATPSPWGWERASGDNPPHPGVGRELLSILRNGGVFRVSEHCHVRTPEEPMQAGSNRFERKPGPCPSEPRWAAQLRHFLDVARGEAEPRVSAVDALATLAATVAVLESARLGRPVEPGFRLEDS